MNPEPAPDDTTRASPSAADRLARLARLVEEFRALPADSDRKREIIAELDDNAAAQPFLVSVVADAGEYDLARTEAATVLRLWPRPTPACATARAGPCWRR